MHVITATRRYVIQTMHSLSALGEGKHGHHMYIEITVPPERVQALDSAYERHIHPRLHGRDLTDLLDAPTGEELVQWIHKQLLRTEIGRDALCVALQETPKNRFISSMSQGRYV